MILLLVMEMKELQVKGNKNICITSRPIIAVAGTVNSQGTSPDNATSKGLEHNKIKAAATISCV
jgi:hypothetical protein